MDKPNTADPGALPPEQLARALGLNVSVIQDHLARGAPANPDGTINLVRYAAWLNQELRHRKHPA